jgi:hypothetical protein
MTFSSRSHCLRLNVIIIKSLQTRCMPFVLCSATKRHNCLDPIKNVIGELRPLNVKSPNICLCATMYACDVTAKLAQMLFSVFLFSTVVRLATSQCIPRKSVTERVSYEGAGVCVEVIQSTFDGLRPGTSDGAIFMGELTLGIVLTDCAFHDCRAIMNEETAGGTICLQCAKTLTTRCRGFGCASCRGQFAWLSSSQADEEWLFYQSSCIACAPSFDGTYLLGACTVEGNTWFTGRYLNFTDCSVLFDTSPCRFATTVA